MHSKKAILHYEKGQALASVVQRGLYLLGSTKSATAHGSGHLTVSDTASAGFDRIKHRITERLRLEVTSEVHLVHTSAQTGPPAATCQMALNMDGDSTALLATCASAQSPSQ